MSPAARTDTLLLASSSRQEWHVVRAAGGAAAAWAEPRPGSGASEDALLVLPLGQDAAVLAVADGMGGVPGGAEAAARAVTTLGRAVEEGLAAGQPLRSCVLTGIEQANAAVLDMANGAATTLAVAEISGGQVRAYNVGDSEVLVLGQRGRLKLRTVSHSPVGFAVQAGLVDDDEALHHEDRHVVSNFLGSRDMRIEVGTPVRLGARDTVIVCSDGLVDNLRASEVPPLVCVGDLDAGVARLGRAASARMRAADSAHPSKPDDLSIVAYRAMPGASVLRRLPPPRQLELGHAGA